MEVKQLIEATASGLRKMDIAPDYLLILTNRLNDEEYNEKQLCGINVIKSYVSINSGYSGYDYPIIPCFISLSEKEIDRQVYLFQRGFENYI